VNKEKCVEIIHKTVSKVLFTTEEFNLTDSRILLEVLIKEGYIQEAVLKEENTNE